MPVYAVNYRYTDDVDTRDALRAEHRDYLARLGDEGTMLLCGPWAPGEPAGALLIFRADDRAAVERVVADDPFTRGGVVERSHVHEWQPILGPLTAAL